LLLQEFSHQMNFSLDVKVILKKLISKLQQLF
jgi:hypothetical protein